MPQNILREIHKKIKPRRKTSHKGDFGRIFVLAGSKGLSGAARLSALAALRSGAGLVTVGVPESIYTIVARQEAELMVKPFPNTKSGSLSFRAQSLILNFLKSQDIFALGPGLSQQHETQRLIRYLIARCNKPLVIDADGINALKNHLSILKRRRSVCILTPHPGEFIRTFGGGLGNSENERKRRAREVARKFNVIIILKGHRSVVAHPNGKIYVNTTGNPGMATAGTGDVLTGVVAAFLGQGLNSWDAARFAVWIHGKAGDLAAKKIGPTGLLASDIIQFLPQVLSKIYKNVFSSAIFV